MVFLKRFVSNTEVILDLGIKNPFSQILKKEGFNVKNTSGEDLDDNYESINTQEYDVLTAFEILEHLVSPLQVLKNTKAKKLLATVPLSLWFSKAYKNNNDSRDRHYHEFEDWQFNWLLEKAGWNIIDTEKWTHPTKKIGLRPILRYFVPRYYAVYAERS